jgi:outer membrane protein TolC
MKNAGKCLLILIVLTLSARTYGQMKSLDFFLAEGLRNNPDLSAIQNLQQYYHVQHDLITAQNKKPQVSFSGDYLFIPYFFDNGRPVSITPTPSPKAYGYDASLTNGGLYAALVNVNLPVFNSAIVKSLYEQNRVQAEISAYSRKQVQHELEKAITDQYIITYQVQQQAGYLQKIIDQLQNRKPLVEALVKKGLLQQNDFLLLDIQLIANKNDLAQLQFSYSNGLSALKNLSFISDTATYILDKPALVRNPAIQEYYYLKKYALDSLNLLAQQHVFNNKYLPQVSLTGSGGINSADIRNLPHNIGLGAGIHVGIPISDGHQRKLFQRQQTVLLANQQIYFSRAAVLQQNNLRNALQQISQWSQVIEMTREPLQKQELLLDIIKDKVIKGQVTVMDYINALQEYAVLQKNKAIAETNLLLYINLYNYYNW